MSRKEFLENLSVLNYLYPTLARDWWFSWVSLQSHFYSKNWKAFLRCSVPLLRSPMIVWFGVIILHVIRSFFLGVLLFLSLSLMLWNFIMMCLPWSNFFHYLCSIIWEYSNLGKRFHLIPGKILWNYFLIIFFSRTPTTSPGSYLFFSRFFLIEG